MNKTEPEPFRYTDDIGDDELPIQFADDSLGCPWCRIKLTNHKSRMFIDGTDIGMFDSLACEFCGFFLLTEKGFDESAKAIKLSGLVIPKQVSLSEQSHSKNNIQYIRSYSVNMSKPAWQPSSINSNDTSYYKHTDTDKNKGNTSLRELPPLTISTTSHPNISSS